MVLFVPAVSVLLFFFVDFPDGSFLFLLIRGMPFYYFFLVVGLFSDFYSPISAEVPFYCFSQGLSLT